jgi:ABC-type nitrate/sulfonate/bicarbonate transport system substrate-binding protein
MRKRIFIYLSWIVVSLSAGNPALSQTPLQKVTLSYSSSGITSIEFFIAKEKKFFQEEGLEPQLVVK